MAIGPTTFFSHPAPPLLGGDMQLAWRNIVSDQGLLTTCTVRAFVNVLANCLLKKYGISIDKMRQVHVLEQRMFEAGEFDGLHVEELCHLELKLLDLTNEQFLTVRMKNPLINKSCESLRYLDRLHAFVHTTGLFCNVSIWDPKQNETDNHSVCATHSIPSSDGEKMLIADNGWEHLPTRFITKESYLCHCEIDVKLTQVQNATDGTELRAPPIDEEHTKRMEAWRDDELNYCNPKTELPARTICNPLTSREKKLLEEGVQKTHEAIASFSRTRFDAIEEFRTQQTEQVEALIRIKEELSAQKLASSQTLKCES